MTEAHLSVIPNEPVYGIDPNGFYQTPNSMTIKAINANLTGADWKLWEYLKAYEPFGDHMQRLDVAEIAKAIKISIRQFKRSLKKLEELGLYYCEPVILQGQNLAGKLARKIAEQKKQLKSSGKNKMTDLAQDRQSRPINDELVQTMTNLSSVEQSCHDQTPEPLPAKDSKTPQTIHTYSDFIQTLSEGEREKFEKFCKTKIEQLREKPALPQKWIEKYWESLWNEFEENEEKRKATEQVIAEATTAETQEKKVQDTPTAESLNRLWKLAKGEKLKRGFEQRALEAGYLVTEEGIFEQPIDSAEGNSSGGRGFKPKNRG